MFEPDTRQPRLGHDVRLSDLMRIRPLVRCPRCGEEHSLLPSSTYGQVFGILRAIGALRCVGGHFFYVYERLN
jgi:hypothetical protein